jgi:hypothetical protein
MREFAWDLFTYFRTHKKYWLVPMFLIFLVFGLLIFLSAQPAIAPFVYTLF